MIRGLRFALVATLLLALGLPSAGGPASAAPRTCVDGTSPNKAPYTSVPGSQWEFGYDYIHLEWREAKPRGSRTPPVTGYRIYAKNPASGLFELIGTAPADARELDWTPGPSWYNQPILFQIAAYGPAGEGCRYADNKKGYARYHRTTDTVTISGKSRQESIDECIAGAGDRGIIMGALTVAGVGVVGAAAFIFAIPSGGVSLPVGIGLATSLIGAVGSFGIAGKETYDSGKARLKCRTDNAN